MFAPQYGLREDPFAPLPDPRFLVAYPALDEALATLLYAVEQQEGWALLLGEAGMGKTMAASALLKQLEPKVAPAVLSLAGLDTPVKLINRLALELGLAGPYRGKAKFLSHLRELIQRRAEQGQVILVVLDDAQAAPAELLEELYLLGNADESSPRVLNIFLLARFSLVHLLQRNEAAGIKQLFRRSCWLEPLGQADTARLVRGRLAAAGGDPELFAAPALELIHQASQGVPRRVCLLAGWCLRKAIAGGRRNIGPALAHEVAEHAQASGWTLYDLLGADQDLDWTRDPVWPLGEPLPRTKPGPASPPPRRLAKKAPLPPLSAELTSRAAAKPRRPPMEPLPAELIATIRADLSPDPLPGMGHPCVII
ncbi:MAG: AAA family ATPase [Thermodesulfobacteriota bacterium]